MAYNISHSRTWLNPNEIESDWVSSRFREADLPVSQDPIENVEWWTNNITQAERLDLHFKIDCTFWGWSPGDPDSFLTETVSYDPLFGVVELYTDFENSLQHTITRFTIPAEEHGYYKFLVSNVVEDPDDFDDISAWYELPKTLTWDNDKEGVGSAPHIYVFLKMEGAPYGLKILPLPFGNLPEILSIGQRGFF